MIVKNNNLYTIANKNRSLEQTNLINSLKCEKFDIKSWEAAIDLDDKEYFENSMKIECFSKSFDVDHSIRHCIKSKSINIYKYFLEDNNNFDYCADVISDISFTNFNFLMLYLAKSKKLEEKTVVSSIQRDGMRYKILNHGISSNA